MSARAMSFRAVAAVLLLGGCGSVEPPDPAETAAAATPAAAVTRHATFSPSDFSVYESETRWRDTSGDTVRLGTLEGRPQVLAMVYTKCTHTCPRILAEFKALEAALPPAERGRVGFTFVSLDPARDTPEQLRAYAAAARLDPSRWTILTGDDASVRELSAVLGTRYRPEAGGEYSHENAYFVLDGAGRIVLRQDGLGRGVERPLAAIRAARAAG